MQQLNAIVVTILLLIPADRSRVEGVGHKAASTKDRQQRRHLIIPHCGYLGTREQKGR